MLSLFPKSHLAELSYLPCLNSLAADDAWLPSLYFQGLMLNLGKEERFLLWTFILWVTHWLLWAQCDLKIPFTAQPSGPGLGRLISSSYTLELLCVKGTCPVLRRTLLQISKD